MNQGTAARPILCFGEALIDLHAEGNDAGFPSRYVPFAGGAPANVAVAVARLGGSARFAGMLGRDRFGDFLLDSLRRAGVGTDDVARTDAANTALALVSLDAHGERSFSFYRGPSADLLFRAAHFRPDTFRDIAVFHVCSNSMTDPELAATTREGMQRAHNVGALVSFDLNLRLALWPRGVDPAPLLWPALHLADVVKLCAEEFAWLAVDGEQAALDRLWLGRTRLVVVTDGAHPIRWFHPDAEGELPCYRVDPVDSTAAGDAFVGGLLCCLADLPVAPDRLDRLVGALPRLHATLRFAAACGALTVTRQGSFAAMPHGSDVLAFMDDAATSTLPDFHSAAFLRAHIARTMAFYHPRAIDPVGGFFQYFKDDGTIYDHRHRHLVSSTRFVVNYALAAIEFDRADYLDAARHGLRYLRDVHRDPATGGYAWTVSDGLPDDRTNHAYGVAFVLLAYASARKAGIAEAAAWMDETWDLLETHYWDADAGLYRDEADARWQFSDYRGQNANMHLCEAMLAAYQASGEPRYLERACTLADHMTRRQAALAGGLVWEHYDRGWAIDWDYHRDDPKHLFRPWGFQPGHQVEWAKLLLIMEPMLIAAGIAHDWLLPTATALFDTALARAWDDEYGGICYGFAPDGSVCDDDKYFWVQAEALAAAALLHARTGLAVYDDWYVRLWTCAWAHFVDHRHGAWYRILTRDNRKYSDEKSPAGKCDYHTMGACHELLRLEKPANV